MTNALEGESSPKYKTPLSPCICESRQEARVLSTQSVLPRGRLIPLKLTVSNIQIKPREQQGPPVSSSLAFSARL